jgi:hypothetical protein
LPGDGGGRGRGRSGDLDRNGLGPERFVVSGGGVEDRDGVGAEGGAAGFLRDEDEILGEGTLEEQFGLDGFLSVRRDDAEIAGEGARTEFVDGGPVAHALEGKRPGDGFADGGFFRNNLGDEGELADGADEVGGGGRGQRADLQR